MKSYKVISIVVCIGVFIVNLFCLGKDIYAAYPYRSSEERAYTFSEITSDESPVYFFKGANPDDSSTDSDEVHSLVNELSQSAYLPLDKSDGSKILWKHNENNECLELFWANSPDDQKLRIFGGEYDDNGIDYPVGCMYMIHDNDDVYLIVHYRVLKDSLLYEYDIQHISGYNLQKGFENDYVWVFQVFKAEQPEEIMDIYNSINERPKDADASSKWIFTMNRKNVVYGIRGYYIYFSPTIIVVVLSIIIYLILKNKMLMERIRKTEDSVES